jgi:hypothetical protein
VAGANAGTHGRRSGWRGRGTTRASRTTRAEATSATGATGGVVMHPRGVVLLVVVVTVVATAVAEDEAGEEDDRDDEHESGDNGYPGRYLEDAGSPVWHYRYGSGRRCSCG